MKKILYVILNLSIVIIETITYFIFKPKDDASFFFIWLLLLIIIVYSIVKGSPTGIHTFTSSLGHNDSMRYLNLSTEMEKTLNGEKKENITFTLERNLFTIIKILIILANLIIYFVLVKSL